MLIVRTPNATKEQEEIAARGGTAGGIVNIIAYVVLINLLPTSDLATRYTIATASLPICVLVTSAAVSALTNDVGLGRAAAFTVAIIEIIAVILSALFSSARATLFAEALIAIIPAIIIAFVIGLLGALIGKSLSGVVRPQAHAETKAPDLL